MTGNHDDAPGEPDATESDGAAPGPTRDDGGPDGAVRQSARARIRTGHGERARPDERVDPETVAGALSPDNTDEMSTAVDDDAVETTIRRTDAAGLRSTVDDYLVNLDVAVRVAQHANRHDDTTHT